VAAPRQDPATTLLLLTISHRTGAVAWGQGPLGEAQPLAALNVAQQWAALYQPQATRWYGVLDSNNGSTDPGAHLSQLLCLLVPSLFPFLILGSSLSSC
jgi:hypothetical protein